MSSALFDAAFAHTGKDGGYFLSGDHYVYFEWDKGGGLVKGRTDLTNPAFHGTIKSLLSPDVDPLFTYDLDAACGSDPTSIYLFKGASFIQYDFKNGGANRPGPIFGDEGLFINATPFPIDAAVAGANHKGFLFSGPMCYEVDFDAPDEFYTSSGKLIHEFWEHLDFASGVDFALPGGDGSTVYFFRGGQYAKGYLSDRSDVSKNPPPAAFNNDSWPGMFKAVYTHTGAEQTFPLIGNMAVHASLWGAGGSGAYVSSSDGPGAPGGGGGYVTGTIPVTAPRGPLTITVGAALGDINHQHASSEQGRGGLGGGIDGILVGVGGGGGMSAVHSGATPLLIAGGGGGGGRGGGAYPGPGGAGGTGGVGGGGAAGNGVNGTNPAGAASGGGGGGWSSETSSRGGTGGQGAYTNGGGILTPHTEAKGPDGAAARGMQGGAGGFPGTTMGGGGAAGGGGGGWSGGGGGGSGGNISIAPSGKAGGGGGGAGGTNFIASTVVGHRESGNGTTPGGTGDPAYTHGVGVGGPVGTALPHSSPYDWVGKGGVGLVVLTW